jgi:aspartyl/asparaginyl beta-hydroxylase (cupin superfamily)
VPGLNQRALLLRAQWIAQHSPAVLELVHRTFGRFSRVSTEPFLDPAEFAWTALLEQHYPAIRAEADRVLRVRDALPNFQDIAPDQIELTADDQWKTFWFVGYGVWDDPNCLRCPVTAAVLRAIPGLTTGFFSILGSGKRLPPHVGPYRGVLRHHLALIVPEPPEQCGIRVGDQTRHWTQAQSLVFDDTYEHEAWNDTDSERVVLFLDIKRPLQPPMNWINDGIIKAVSKSPFVKAARAQHVAREQQFTRAWNATIGPPELQYGPNGEPAPQPARPGIPTVLPDQSVDLSHDTS